MATKDIIKNKTYAYYYQGSSKRCLLKIDVNNKFYEIQINDEKFSKGSNYYFEGRLVDNTSIEENHWLEKCIKYNKYISFEEAMKTFNQEIQYEIC